MGDYGRGRSGKRLCQQKSRIEFLIRAPTDDGENRQSARTTEYNLAAVATLIEFDSLLLLLTLNLYCVRAKVVATAEKGESRHTYCGNICCRMNFSPCIIEYN